MAHLLTELGQPELESESCIPLQQGSMLLNGNLHLQHAFHYNDRRLVEWQLAGVGLSLTHWMLGAVQIKRLLCMFCCFSLCSVKHLAIMVTHSIVVTKYNV